MGAWWHLVTRNNMAKTFLRVLEDHSPETYCHSLSVAGTTNLIATELGLSAKEVVLLTTAALLHDVGKVHVDKAILNKPGPLTEEEWAVMRTHPVRGVEMLAEIEEATPLLPIIYYHHERWDGMGYMGLRGEDIPLGARIVALADAFDAMTAGRPYQPPRDLSSCLVELRSKAGTQFDPALVDLLFSAAVKLLKGIV